MTTITSPAVTLDDRAVALSRYVQSATHNGWRVVSQSQSQAQLIKGKPTSHLLHLVLSIITFGFWIPIWIAAAVFGGEKQQFVTVDEYGSVHLS